MSHRYVEILVLYVLASFGAILALTECTLWLVREKLLSILERLRPSDGVIAHIVLRLLPTLVALALTSSSAIPGYFNGEPTRTHELPGPWLVGLAGFGLYSLVAPLIRASWLGIRTAARTKAWLESAVRSETFSRFPVVELALTKPVLVASGLLRKSIFVSSPVRSLLSARELRAALRHEVAHCRQHHNLAKLICAVAPRLLPVKALDDSMREAIEYAADDEACRTPGDALNLASALVILARQTTRSAEMLYTHLIDPRQTARLERRVERLVVPTQRRNGTILAQLAAGCAAMVAAMVMIGSLPVAQNAFRDTLELLVK